MKIFQISNHLFSTHIKIISTHAFHLGQRQNDTSIITYRYYLWQFNIWNNLFAAVQIFVRDPLII